VYLLAADWWDGWRAYTGYAGAPAAAGAGGAPPPPPAPDAPPPSPPAAPGRVQNRGLLEGGALHLSSSGNPQPSLKPELEEGRDYAVVRAATWQLLTGWYGGGPAIERTAVLEGLAPNSKKPRINLYPMRLEIWCYSEKACKYLEADAGVSEAAGGGGELGAGSRTRVCGSSGGGGGRGRSPGSACMRC
jgi:hypothetical protein